MMGVCIFAHFVLFTSAMHIFISPYTVCQSTYLPNFTLWELDLLQSNNFFMLVNVGM